MQSESPDLNIIGLQAKQASKKMAQATTEEKNRALGFLAKALHEQMAKILSANAQDIQEGVMANLSADGASCSEPQREQWGWRRSKLNRNLLQSIQTKEKSF